MSTPVNLKDLTIENITDNVHAINSQCSDPRMKFVIERTVTHLHDLAREVRLTTNEWMTALLVLTKVGQISSDTRQEFILLSDVLGLSLLVDSIDHPRPKGSTEGTVLGPFHTHESQHEEQGSQISHDSDGEPLLVLCTVKDINGTPIAGAEIDVWETDSKGFYDVQHANRSGPDGRAILRSDESGRFWFKAIVPVPYPILHDGPIGQLLKALSRHLYRPSHMHFMFKKTGYDPLITALYLKNDPCETTDAVFGVKDSLVVTLEKVVDEQQAKAYGVELGSALSSYDFVLVTDEAVEQLRQEKAKEALTRLGSSLKVVSNPPIPSIR